MSKSICELKIELKAKGIKGITGLNKSGLEALLKGGKSEPKKEYAKPKPFVPAPTKGESPKVAEKTITKKITVPKTLMLTYKPKKEEPKKEVKSKTNDIKEEFTKIFLEGDLEFINNALIAITKDSKQKLVTDDDRMKRMKELQTKFFRSKETKREFITKYNSLDNCNDVMCKYGINSKEEYKKWILKNHPDKGGTVNDAEFKQIIICAKKNKFCKY